MILKLTAIFGIGFILYLIFKWEAWPLIEEGWNEQRQKALQAAEAVVELPPGKIEANKALGKRSHTRNEEVVILEGSTVTIPGKGKDFWRVESIEGKKCKLSKVGEPSVTRLLPTHTLALVL